MNRLVAILLCLMGDDFKMVYGGEGIYMSSELKRKEDSEKTEGIRRSSMSIPVRYLVSNFIPSSI